MNNQLEMLSQREQLMWDIDGIVEDFACNNNINEDDMEDLIRTLCDTVCKNFPTNWCKLQQQLIRFKLQEKVDIHLF